MLCLSQRNGVCTHMQVVVAGIVTGDFQGPNAVGLQGFFIQTPDASADADPTTSEGGCCALRLTASIYIAGPNQQGTQHAASDILRCSIALAVQASSSSMAQLPLSK